MTRIISLKYPAKCRDCGADLEVGAKARYYGRGRVYGVECHSPVLDGVTGYRFANGSRVKPRHFENAGHEASYYDPHGAYSPDGTYLGSTGPRCEDAPCCGCCS